MDKVLRAVNKRQFRLDDSLIVHPSKGLKKELEAFHESNDGEHIRAIIGLSNASFSKKSRVAKGVVFVTDGAMPAVRILGLYHDLIGGVSVYCVEGFSFSGESGKPLKIDEQIKKMMQRTREKPFAIDTSLIEDEEQAGITIGKHNSSIGIYKSMVNMEDFTEAWHIVVKSHYTAGSNKIHRLLNENPQLTMAQLHESSEYKTALSDSQKNRDGLAAAFASYLGAKFVKPTRIDTLNGVQATFATPDFTNVYNVVQRISDFEGQRAYAFYAGCYGFAEHQPIAIAFGRSPDQGYEIIGYGNTSVQQAGKPEYAYGYPMGSPRNTSDDRKTLTSTPEATRKIGDLIHWAGRSKTHTKADNRIYQSNFIDTEVGREHLSLLGFRKPAVQLKLLPRGLYVASHSEYDASIKTLIEYNPTLKTLFVPRDHVFIDDKLIPGYRSLQARDARVKLYGDILVGETDKYMEFSMSRVKEILALYE